MVNVCGFVNDSEKKGRNRVINKLIAMATQYLNCDGQKIMNSPVKYVNLTYRS